MANNQHVNKVVFGAVSIIDITPTTAVESDVAQGRVFFKADGSQATGSLPTTTHPNPTISVSSSGLITASHTQGSGVVTGGTTTATEQLSTQSAQTIHLSTTDQTIASGKYLTGTQTIKAVTMTNLTAENIAEGVTVKIGDSTDDDCVASITGTHSGGGGGLDYETGTWTPASDIAYTYIAFANAHTEAPLFVLLADEDDAVPKADVNVSTCLINYNLYLGHPLGIENGTIFRYAANTYVYSGTNVSGPSVSVTSATSSAAVTQNYCTSSGFYVRTNSSSRYWKSTKTYKWIAVWKPTT